MGDREWAGGLPFDVQWDYTYEGFIRQHRESLHRMGHGRVECLVIHDMEQAEVEVENGTATTACPCMGLREQLRSGILALEELRRKKVIRAFGAGLNSAEGRAEDAYRKWNRNYLDFLIDMAPSGER